METIVPTGTTTKKSLNIVGFNRDESGNLEFKNPISEKIWKDRYQKNDESIESNIGRVAKAIADTNDEYQEFRRVMTEGKFFPAGRIMSNMGTGTNTTAGNCFTCNGIPDSMEGIFDMVKLGALAHKMGGGTGYALSLLRPEGTPTSNDAIASGPVSFMKVLNAETDTINQGSRRGANLANISVYHPDLETFINCKNNPDDPKAFQYFNLSVMIDDAFMKAVGNDEEIWQHFPIYDEQWNKITDESKWTHKTKVRARDLWDKITRRAYESGEPGVLFEDNLNRFNNTAYTERIVTTNPCAEYLAGAVVKDGELMDWRGACNLGSLVLPAFLYEDEDRIQFDYAEMERTVSVAVRALDNVIDKANYPDPSFEAYQKNMRTIGLGFTGLGNVLALMGQRYGSEGARQLTSTIIGSIAAKAYETSIELAKEKEPFPMFDAEGFLKSEYLDAQRSFSIESRQAGLQERWNAIARDIEKYGIRNARMLSVAPTGTLSLVWGNNTSSGVEPTFMRQAKRWVKFNGQDDSAKREVTLYDPAWEWYKNRHPEADDSNPPDSFTSALELDAAEHVGMLVTIARLIDMSVSKTINIPKDYDFDATKDVFMRCWKGGAKGCTIFRPNDIREGVFITDDGTKKDDGLTSLKLGTEEIRVPPEVKEKLEEELSQITAILSKGTYADPLYTEVGLPRGAVIQVDDNTVGLERHLQTGCGTLHFQAYFDPSTGTLLETYASRGSKGGCMSNQTALSRMISLAARVGAPTEAIVDQLLSAPACIAYNNRARDKKDTSKGMSCPAAMGFALKDMYEQFQKMNGNGVTEEEPMPGKLPEIAKEEIVQTLDETPKGDHNDRLAGRCPECGEPLVADGGCVVCMSCGASRCE